MRQDQPHTIESRAKISRSLTGERNGMKGRKKSKAAKAAQSRAMKRVWASKRAAVAAAGGKPSEARFVRILPAMPGRTFKDDVAEIAPEEEGQ